MTAVTLLALSDLHGKWFQEAAGLIAATQPGWIVLCGDLLPDFGRISGQESRLTAQRDFWRTYRSKFIRPFAVTTLVRGNHEIEGFRDRGLDRVPAGLVQHVVRLEGIPIEFGAFGWSREWEEEDLEEELGSQLREVPEPWIYVNHVPPFGCLDQTTGGRVGHRPLLRHLEARQWPQALVLCGHVHEDFGHQVRGGTLVVNVACGYALVRWSEEDGPVLLAQGRLEAPGESGGDSGGTGIQ
ncbi:MAG: metallophosphoesterase [Holophaga sp.]|jgi:Icc-related predicted phosphoesterase